MRCGMAYIKKFPFPENQERKNLKTEKRANLWDQNPPQNSHGFLREPWEPSRDTPGALFRPPETPPDPFSENFFDLHAAQIIAFFEYWPNTFFMANRAKHYIYT